MVGCNSFDFIVKAQLEDVDIEVLKQNDEPLFKAKSKEWLLRYLEAGHGSIYTTIEKLPRKCPTGKYRTMLVHTLRPKIK